MEWTTVDPNNVPSTYQQVIANMMYLQENVIPAITELQETILNPEPIDPETGKSRTDVVVGDDDVMRVAGVSLMLADMATDTSPSSYVRNVTFELKRAEALGLTGQKGITLDLVTLVTFRNTDEAVSYPSWQVAIGDQGMIMYYRTETAVGSDAWGEWTLAAGGGGGHRQIIDSETQPEDQEPGDYWLETIP